MKKLKTIIYKIWYWFISLPADKLMHFSVCLLITLLVGTIKPLVPYAMLFALAVGVIKETVDAVKARSINYFSMPDIFADFIGAFVGQLFIGLYFCIY